MQLSGSVRSLYIKCRKRWAVFVLLQLDGPIEVSSYASSFCLLFPDVFRKSSLYNMVVVEAKQCRAMASTSFRIDHAPPECDQITELVPHLYICGASSLTLDNMNKYNISLIINATAEVYLRDNNL